MNAAFMPVLEPNVMDWPMISCIMPTWNRRRFVPLAIRCFLAQDYAGPLELLVIDDGDEAVGDLVQAAAEAAPAGRRVRYLHLIGRHTTGAKLNYGCNVAEGDLLALWADDDWHAPWRLSRQAEVLLSNGYEVCGSDRCLFWDVRRGVAARYYYVPGRASSGYLVGGTLMFRRVYWEERPFEAISNGEDNEFIAGRLAGRAGFAEPDFYCALIHGGNTSPAEISEHEQFQPVELSELRWLMDGMFEDYEQFAAS